MKHLLLVPLFCLGLAACTAPGFSFDPDDHQLTQPQPEQADYALTPVTAGLVAKQQAAAMQPPERNPALAQAIASYEYRIEPLDVLSVTVWDHPELTIPAGEYRNPEDSGRPVDAEGDIYYPYVGTLHVAGMSTSQVRSLLTDRLAKYIKDPQLDVRVAAFRSQRVHVTGQVKQPGVVPITDVPLTLLDAINGTGGVTELGDLSHVFVTHDGHTQVYDVQALLNDGDLTQNMLLKPGDIIHVPDSTLSKVHVMGELMKPGSYPMYKGRMNLAEAIGAAGGIDPTTSNPGQIFVFRNVGGKPKIFWLDAESPVSMVLATEFRLQPQDVVYVANVPMARYNRVIGQVLPTIQALWQTAIIERELRRNN